MIDFLMGMMFYDILMDDQIMNFITNGLDKLCNYIEEKRKMWKLKKDKIIIKGV